MHKRWMYAVLISLLALLACSAAIVYVADPFQVYRLASWFTPSYDNSEEAYYNAGLARHSDYDAVFIGTSMVENTRVSQVDALFGTRCIKLPFEAGMANNHAEALRVAFSTRELTHVFYGMDVYSFVREPDFSNFSMPRYLYDGNPFNDVNYLLNGDILMHRIPAILYHKLRGDEPAPATPDTIFAWADKPNAKGQMPVYGEESVLGSYDFRTPAQEMLSWDVFAANASANFDKYVKPFLEAHPGTTFHFFFPPYSSLQWYMMRENGQLDAILYTREQLAELLLAYPNARLHDFSANQDWIEDFSLHADYSHYGPQVNEWIVEELAGEDFLVDDVYDVPEHNDILYDVVDNFEVPLD